MKRLRLLKQKGFAHFELLLVMVVILAIAGAGWYVFNKSKGKNSVDQPSSTILQKEEIKPELTYKGAYNGKLYLTGEKVGDSAPWEVWIRSLDRNGIETAISYFGIEPLEGDHEEEEQEEDVNSIVDLVKDEPGRFVPFYSTGIGGESEGEIAGSKLTGYYKSGYDLLTKLGGKNFVKGIGEVETQDWPMPHDDKRVLQLFSFATERKLNVMYHVKTGQSAAVGRIAAQYPNTIFLIHMFPNDYDIERNNIIAQMKKHKNIIYTLDADHLMFDTSGGFGIGLLYKYENVLTGDDLDPDPSSIKDAAKKFNANFDEREKVLRKEALSRYGSLVKALPDQVTVGTELNLRYGYEQKSFDRIIKHLRFFIAGFDSKTQIKLAYKNAQKAFGKGVSL
ncbi:MAG TPA: hypothetical protein VJJ78_03590 [Candidatus Saccharimonadales bacterium]|nr:hypothetical protein [Candidatus Saccharimonadales bacterium]